MVLFHEEKEEKEKKPKSRIRRLFNVLMVIAFLFFCGLMVLAGFNGNNQLLKEGFQEYLGKATGASAAVNRFDYMGFFPTVRLDAGAIELTYPDESAPAVVIDSIVISRRFWDQFFSRRIIEKFVIEGMRVRAGLVTAREIDIDFLGLEEKGPDGKPAFVARGRYGGEAFDAHLAMAMTGPGTGKRRHFTRLKETAFAFHAPFLALEGIETRARGGGMGLDISALGAPEKMLEGRVVLRAGKGGRVLEGSLKSAGADIDSIASGLHKAYCALTPPGRPLLADIDMNNLMIDGVPLPRIMEKTGPCGGASP